MSRSIDTYQQNLTEQTMQLRNCIVQEQDTNAQLVVANSQLSDQLKDALENISVLKKQCDDQVKDIHRAYDDKQEQVARESQASLRQVQHEKLSLQQANDDLRKEINRVISEYDTNAKSVDTYKNQLRDQHEKNKQLAMDLEEAKRERISECEKMEHTLMEEKTARQNMEITIGKKDEKIKEVEHRLSEIVALKTQKNKMSDELSNLRKENEIHTNQNANLQSTINELNVSLENQEKEIKDKMSRYNTSKKDFEQSIDSMKKDIDQ